MVTEQVKRIQAVLRECGFKRGEWTVRAERKHKRDRSNRGARYIEFGPAHATPSYKGRADHDAVVARAMECRWRFVDLGLVVTVFEGDDNISFVLLTEPRFREEPHIVRRAHNYGEYVEKRPMAVAS